MSKIGVNINIDVSKLLKEHFVKGEKGTYVDLVVFIDPDNQDQYGNNGGVKQSWKDCDNKQTPFVGNCKVFWKDTGSTQGASTSAMPPADDDDVPF